MNGQRNRSHSRRPCPVRGFKGTGTRGPRAALAACSGLTCGAESGVDACCPGRQASAPRRPASGPAAHTPGVRTVDIVGDKWSLLIIRDAFDGIRRFSQFQRDLGIAKNILTARLRDLVEAGVLRVEPAPGGGAYQEYALTEKGDDLFDLLVSLRQWGQDHAFAPGEPHSVLVDEETGRPLPRLGYTTPDGRQVQARETRVRKVGEPEP